MPSSPHGATMALEGKGAVVTGGGRGIGAAIARALAGRGVGVVVAARTAAEIDGVAHELTAAGQRAWAVQCDVTDPASVRTLAERATADLGQVDILVNNAGFAHSAPLHAIALEDWQRLFAVNATGTLLCTQAFGPPMAARGWGRIVNVASVAGVSGTRYITAYAASKHAVIGLTRCVAAELAAKGVTVNAVCPSYVDTDMTHDSIERITDKTGMSRERALEAILNTTPQRRLIAPEEVAHVVVSLCADDAGSVNGQAIVQDGGTLLA